MSTGDRGQSRCVRTGWKVSSLFQELLSHSTVLKTNHLFYIERLGSQEIGAWISESFHLISIFDCLTSSLHTSSFPSNGKVNGHLAMSEYLATNQLATSCVAFEDWESSIPSQAYQLVNGGYHLRSTRWVDCVLVTSLLLGGHSVCSEMVWWWGDWINGKHTERLSYYG